MAFKIVNPADHVSQTAWADVDKTAIPLRIALGHNADDHKVSLANREMYALQLCDDPRGADIDSMQLPHHEIDNDDDIVLNINGLKFAAGLLPSVKAPAEKLKAAAAHLARHYEQLKMQVPTKLSEIIKPGKTTRPQPRQVFTLDAAGKPIDLLTSQPVTPRVGSIMAMRFFNYAGGPDYTQNSNDSADSISLAARKDSWPEGRDDNGKFFFATFRALSAGLVNPNTWPIDFSKNEGKVLKRGTRMLKGKPWLKDHARRIDSQIGSITDVIWDEGDAKRSAGINALTRTNLEAPQSDSVAPLLEAGDANSTSVTVWYEWEKSHEDLDDWDFFSLWGEEIDGELVRLIVTKVLDLTELSVVWDGADPDAKRISAAADEAAGFVCCAVGLPPGTDGPQISTMEQPDGGRNDAADLKELLMLEKLKQALSKVTGQAQSDINEDFLTDIIVGTQGLADLPPVVDLLASKQTKIDEVSAVVTARDEEIVTLKAQAELGATYLTDTRAAAVRFYKLAKGDKASPAILAMIEKASLAEVIELRKEFRADADKALPLTCDAPGCNSTKFSRAQSLDTADDEAGGDDSDDADTKNDDDVLVDLSD